MKRRKIHCLNPISKLGTGLFPEEYEIVDSAAEADGILVRSASMHEMEFSENLRAVARAGAGVNNIPLDACAERGIVVFNTPGANANGVKELVIAGLILSSRDIAGGIQWRKKEKENPNIAKDVEKAKKAFAGHEIKGKKLGVIGLGAIGAEVANAAAAIRAAIKGLDKRAVGLDEYRDSIVLKKPEGYTEESYAAYKNAYDALMALDSKETTAEMFANAKSAFEAAQAGLVQKPGSNGTGSSSNGTVSNGAVATGDTVNVSALAGLFLSLLMIAAFMKRKTFLGFFEKDE